MRSAAVGMKPLAIPARIGYFFWHFVEMCVIMCLGTGILAAFLRAGGALIGYPEPTRQLPEASVLVLAVWLSLLMLLWTRFRGHGRRATVEMVAACLVALPLALGAAWVGAVPRSRLYGLECGVACVLMLGLMLYRLDLYTTHHARH